MVICRLRSQDPPCPWEQSVYEGLADSRVASFETFEWVFELEVWDELIDVLCILR